MTEDKTLVCRDCGGEFVFTQGEQTFFAERGFSEPIRCKSCRDTRKSQKNEHGGGGGGFDRNGSGGGRNRW